MVFELLPLNASTGGAQADALVSPGVVAPPDSGLSDSGLSDSSDSVRRHLEGGAIRPENAVVGTSYELVTTNLSGLWRCRIGDVVRVIGKHKGQVPVVLFEYRQGQVLNAKGEKSSERCLLQAMARLDLEAAGEQGNSGGRSATFGVNDRNTGNNSSS